MIAPNAEVREALRRIARDAVALRRSWEKARATRDPRKRIEALWPYLWNYGVAFLMATEKELQRMGPVAGDFLAARIETMGERARGTLLPHASAYHSRRLHDAIRAHPKRERDRYDRLLATYHLSAEAVVSDFRHMPADVRSAWSEVGWSVFALSDFKDRKDLPFLREIGLWCVKRGMMQTCDENVFRGFYNMPDPANLPVIEAAWRQFSVHRRRGGPPHPADFLYVLEKHRYPEAVPVLVLLLGESEDECAARAQLPKADRRQRPGRRPGAVAGVVPREAEAANALLGRGQNARL